MESQPAGRLAHDHAELDKLLTELQEALNGGDLEASHAKLDLFWARLAVHIRAEHLHLFPWVMSRVGERVDRDVEPSLSEAQSTIERLRADHDFFMHELARTIGILRECAKDADSVAHKLKAVRDAISEIAKRLIVHNEIEENAIYLRATTLFDQEEQRELLTRIEAELAHYPSRFTLDTWSVRT
jgi:hemerythrin superfamily protein